MSGASIFRLRAYEADILDGNATVGRIYYDMGSWYAQFSNGPVYGPFTQLVEAQLAAKKHVADARAKAAP